MANNKVILADGTVLMDLTDDSVAPGYLLAPYTAHGKDGAPITGTIATRSRGNITTVQGVTTVPAGYYPSTMDFNTPANVHYYYSGTSVPTSSVGSDGDLYFKTS